MKEEWRLAPMNAPHYGHYWVSNFGRVKNERGRILKGGFDTKGYPHVCVKLEGVQSTYKVHRLVAIAFIPNPDNLPQVNHIDGNKTNNSVTNLEWCTGEYNLKHKKENGLCSSMPGEEHPRHILTEQQVIEIYLDTSHTQKELGTMYGVSRGTIQAIKYGRLWSHVTKNLREDDSNEK